MTGSEFIKLRTVSVGEGSMELYFTVKKTTPLRKLKRSYSESKGVGVASLRFFFNGFRISDADTAEGVGLTEKDTIYVYAGLGSNTRLVES